jgi:hypothetical protein
LLLGILGASVEFVDSHPVLPTSLQFRAVSSGPRSKYHHTIRSKEIVFRNQDLLDRGHLTIWGSPRGLT